MAKKAMPMKRGGEMKPAMSKAEMDAMRQRQMREMDAMHRKHTGEMKQKMGKGGR